MINELFYYFMAAFIIPVKRFFKFASKQPENIYLVAIMVIIIGGLLGVLAGM